MLYDTAMRALLVAVVMVCGLGAVAAARPGGGNHYSGGSHSSGGGSHSSGGGSHSSFGSHSGGGGGGGGGSGDGNGWSPQMVVVVLLGVSLFIGVSRSKRSGWSAMSPPPAMPLPQPPWLPIGLGELVARDPQFDRARFEARAMIVMGHVNQAWLAGDMGPARPLVSDGVYVRFQTYLALLAARGLRNAMADWRPLAAQIVSARSDGVWDVVHVGITAEARDVDVPLKLSPDDAARAIRGAPLEPYEEIWSFVRRCGRTTSADALGGALASRCASCGAPLPRSAVVRCDTCKALTNSGAYDWVLAEITQPEELDLAAGTADVPGLAAIRARDPDVSAQDLEDRASLVFWKWIQARVTGDRKPLDRFCAVAGPPIERADLSEVAVGGCVATDATSDGALDRVHVDLRWSARAGGGDPFNTIDTITLVRAATAVSSRGLSTLDCPHCGGPLADSDDVTCRYCGATLTGAAAEWALESIQPRA